MKIILDLSHSINNYYWEDKEELKDFLEKAILDCLWEHYRELDYDDKYDEQVRLRLYDILDMFRCYEIKGGEENEIK